MPGTAKIETLPKKTVDHDYAIQMGDHFLELVKKLIPNAELRHELLPTMARMKSASPIAFKPPPALERTLNFYDRSLPIHLQSPIILAAGGNKNGSHLPHFAAMGFGGISVGTGTLKPREGNLYRPRVRLLPADRAIQNAMGLNNPGIQVIAREVDKALGTCHKRKLALGISVAESPGLESPESRLQDLLSSFRTAYRAADYVEINVSCPNTGDERIDGHMEFLKELMVRVMEVRRSLAPRKAVFAKLSPDMSEKVLDATLGIVADAGVTGLVLFNTFPGEKARYLNPATPESEIRDLTADGKKGGLSGRFLYRNTLAAVRFIKKQLPHLSILACGGVDHGAKVLDLLEAGADAVQCYSVLAYRWNAIQKMNKELHIAMLQKGIPSLNQPENA